MHHGTKNILTWRKKNPGYQNGSKNPAWKGGSRSYHRRQARKVLNESNVDQTICRDCKRKCSKKRKRWDIHHKDENKFNIKKSNLVPLCPRCHCKRHRRMHESRRDKKTGQYTTKRFIRK